jgi:hypothetical protein
VEWSRQLPAPSAAEPVLPVAEFATTAGHVLFAGLATATGHVLFAGLATTAGQVLFARTSLFPAAAKPLSTPRAATAEKAATSTERSSLLRIIGFVLT